VFQNYSHGAPTLKKAAGRIEGVEADDIVFSVLAGQPLELVLEDGRRTNILLAGLAGDFEGPSAGPSRCAILR
jgi:nicotinamidase-related amidase